ncbi:MAG: hypothetical protein U0271_30375 [Polyangiaceae bacterium]
MQRARSLVGGLVLGAMSLAACSPQRQAAPARAELSPAASGTVVASAPSASAPSSASVASVAPAVDDDSGFTELEVDGYKPSLVFVPHPGRAAPVIIVTHGAGGRPEPHCKRYRELAGDSAFLLCTAGRTIDVHQAPEQRRYFYDGHQELGREVVAALQALEARYGERVDPERRIFAGYSQGATMGILALEQGVAASAKIRRILLVEGGSHEWNIAIANRLHEDGVDRVAIVCGQTSCREAQEQSVRWMKKGGLDVRPSYAPGAGHTYEGTVAPLVDDAFAWLVDDDPRFAGRERTVSAD